MKSDDNNGTSDADRYTSYMTHRSVALRMGNVSGKRYTEKTHFMLIFFFENRAVCEIMWNNIADRGRTHDNIICRMRTTCWIHKATNTLSQYVIFVAFPLPQWLHE